MFPIRTLVPLAVLFALTVNSAMASIVQYHFSAAVGLETRNNFQATPEQRLFSIGDIVSGSFFYDNGVVDGVPGFMGGTFYPAMSGLSGSILGNGFSDPGGAVGVRNDSFDPNPSDPNNPLVDFLILLADTPASGQIDLSGFEVVNGATTFALVNVRLFWIEESTDFFDDQSLPSFLPPVNPGAARLALDFVDITNPGNVHIVFAEPLAVTAVPLPPAMLLLTSALTLLGLRNRRNRGRTALAP